jgi:hypothetical protein
MKNKFLAPNALAFAIYQLFAAAPAWADSALGADTVLSNTLAPRAMLASPALDARGKSLFILDLQRTPGGQLYSYPFEPPLYVPLNDDWVAHLSAEVGALHNSHPVSSAKFNERRDWSNGLLLNSFNFGVENEKSARYLEAAGGGLTRDDQFMQVKYGHYNDYKVRFYYNELAQPFGGGARTFFDGASSGNLTLRPGFGLVPGGAGLDAAGKANDALNMQRALQGVDLGLTRKKAGLESESFINDETSVLMRYSQERREGSRPFAGTMGFVFAMTPAGGGATNVPTGSAVETIEPIDYRTHDVLTSVRWVKDTAQANLTYTGSFFRNNIDTLTWENPYSSAGGPGVLKYGRTDLAPNNDFHNLKLELATSDLPMRGQLNGSLSIGRMTQNDAYIAPIVNTGLLVSPPISSSSTPLANPTPFTSTGAASASPVLNASLWNTTDALSQKSANAKIGTWLGTLGGSIQPSDDLTVRGKVRRYAEDNSTSYTAYNPLTGQYGYVALDGGLWINSKGYSGIYSDTTGTIASPSGNIDVLRSVFPIRYRSIPFEYRKDNYNVDADYRLARRTTLSLGYEREEYTRTHRERDRTWENRLRAALNNRDLEWATVRLSYEYGKRAGSTYNSDPYEEFIMSPAAPLASTQGGNSGNLMAIPPHTLEDLRKFDLSDRIQRVANARVNFMLRQDMDLMLSGKVLDNSYDADFGRSLERTNSLNADWNWNLSPRTGTYAHYSFQRTRQRQANINDAASGPYNLGNEDGKAGGANYPLANAWSQSATDKNHAVGFGVRHAFGNVTLDSNFNMLFARTSNAYTYASTAAMTSATNAALIAQAGNGMDDTLYRQNTLDTSLTFHVKKNMAWRLFHRYDRAKFADWHYDGLQNVYNNIAFLGAGPQSYSVNTVGVFFQYSMN